MQPILVFPETKKQLKAVKAFMVALNVRFEDGGNNYDPAFVAKIKQGEQEFKEGKFKTVSLDNIWKLG